MCDLKVAFIKQNQVYDCWLAALRMLVKYRDGANAEPVGYPEVLQAGVARQQERDAVRTRLARPTGAPEPTAEEELDRRRQVREALDQLPSIGLAPAQFSELARRNGLLPVERPPSGKWTKDGLVALLREHGPVWCALDRLHVIVLKGVTADGKPIVHDPEANEGDSQFSLATFNLQLRRDPHAMLYLPPR